MTQQALMQYLAKKRIAVVGLGLSGLATVRFLLSKGIKPVLMDTRKQPTGLEQIAPEKVDGIYLGELDANRLAKMLQSTDDEIEVVKKLDSVEASVNYFKSAENIDLILGGHTHTFLPEPQTFANRQGKNVLVNQVGWAGLLLGRIDFFFDTNKNPSFTL